MRLVTLAAAAVFFAATGTVGAEGFAVSNQSSFARAAAIPALGGAALLDAGRHESRAVFDWSNEYFDEANSREALTLDAETRRFALSYRRGFGEGWEWQAELPLIFSGGGLLDSPIEGWHDAFGLPNAGRERAVRDRYLIRYQRDGRELLRLTEGATGLGDARLSLGYGLTENTVLRALLQLPTGDKTELTGGHPGLATWADWLLPLGEAGSTVVTLSGGGSVVGKGGPLSSQQNSVAGFGGASLVTPLFWSLKGIVQFNFHSALYKGSALKPLNGASGQLAFGLRVPFAGGQFDIGVQEDVVVNTSPDFSLHFAVAFRDP